jgi:hypothetical protein
MIEAGHYQAALQCVRAEDFQLRKIYLAMRALEPPQQGEPTEAEIKAMARALAIADGKDPDAPAWVRGYGPRAETWGVCWRDQYSDKARAAIAALRQVSDPAKLQPIGEAAKPADAEKPE